MNSSLASLLVNRLLRKLLIVSSFLYFLTACAPSAQYGNDPLSNIRVGPDSAGQHLPSLAVIISENTHKALKLVEEGRSQASLGGLNFAFNYQELDAGYLTGMINSALAQGFSPVEIKPDLNAVDRSVFDAVMVLEIQVNLGKTSSATTSVAISGIFLDEGGQPRVTISGNGEAIVPYPATSYSFKPAADQSVATFTDNLTRSGIAASFAGRQQPVQPATGKSSTVSARTATSSTGQQKEQPQQERLEIKELQLSPETVSNGDRYSFTVKFQAVSADGADLPAEVVFRILQGSKQLFESRPAAVSVQSGFVTSFTKKDLPCNAPAGRYDFQVVVRAGSLENRKIVTLTVR